MRKAGRANICHPEVCLLLSLTACLAALESQLISKVWPSPGQGTQPPWRGGNTWHCSGAIPAASYSQQHCSLWGHGKQIAQQLLQKLCWGVQNGERKPRLTPMVALVALPRFQSSTNTTFTWLAKAKCEQAFTDEEELQNLPQTPSALCPQTVL